MIAIIDYGMANLRSVERALIAIGGDPLITGDPEIVAKADHVILPGVGAFCACMSNLNNRGLSDSVRQAISSGKPFLGICVGLQMLFDSSSEMGASPGLKQFPGRVIKFFEDERPASTENFKVPHIGWNTLSVNPKTRLLAGLKDGDRVYFVHSYYPVPADNSFVAATSDYGIEFCCAVERGNVAATQFHPEKSGAVGLQILRNFIGWQTVVSA